jgi:hypothetical protein
MLTIKGYYGKGIEIPLTLLKTNFRFDPNSGDHLINCEFTSKTFAVLNDILLIYGLIVHKMFKDEKGYKGYRMLEEVFNEDPDYSKKFDKVITLYDLNKTFNDLAKTKSVNSEVIIINNKKNQISYFLTEAKLLYEDINTYITDNTNNAIIVSGESKIYTLKTDRLNIESYFNRYIDAVSNLNVISDIKSLINKSDKQKIEIADKIFDINLVLKGDKFNLDLLRQQYEYSRIAAIEYENQLSKESFEPFKADIKKRIGFEPTLSNVMDIIMNNIEAFLRLLKETGLKATKQCEDTKQNKIRFNYNSSESLNKNFKRVYPFPEYYKLNEKNQAQEKTYPGRDVGSNEWAEVEFVEEIYSAIERLNLDIQKDFSDSNQLISKGLVNFITPLLSNNSNIQTPYTNLAIADVIGEYLNKISLAIEHNGISTRIYSEEQDKKIVESLSKFELNLLKIQMDLRSKNIDVYTFIVHSIFRQVDDNDYYNKLCDFITKGLSIDDITNLETLIKNNETAVKNNTKLDYSGYAKYINKFQFKKIFDLLNNSSNVFNKATNIYDNLNEINRYSDISSQIEGYDYDNDEIIPYFETNFLNNNNISKLNVPYNTTILYKSLTDINSNNDYNNINQEVSGVKPHTFTNVNTNLEKDYGLDENSIDNINNIAKYF